MFDKCGVVQNLAAGAQINAVEPAVGARAIQNGALFGVLGKGIKSRTFAMPVM